MLYNEKAINTALGSDRIYDAVTDDQYLYVVNQEPAYKKYELSSGYLMHSTSLATNAAGIALINNASAVVVYDGSANRYDFIELSSGAKSSVTGQSYSLRNSLQTQAVDGDRGNEIIIATTNSNTLRKIIADQTSSNITISEMAGQRANCILAEQASGTFFLGGNDGKVYNIDASGTVNSIVTIPTGLSESSSSIEVTGLSFWDPYLCVATEKGFLYLFNYWTQELISTQIVSDADGTTYGTAMCPSSSGEAMVGGSGGADSISCFESVAFKNGQIIRSPYFIANPDACMGVSRSKNHAVAWFNETLSWQMVIVDTNSSEQVGVKTTAYSSGIETAARIIRIRNDGVGKKCIELDTTIPAATTYLDATDGLNYIEMSTISSNTQWSIRDVQA